MDRPGFWQPPLLGDDDNFFVFINDSNVSLSRNVLGTKKLGDILSERESIANEMQDLLREATEAWGVTVERVEVNCKP